jgi:cytochrome o ubiquinol oxidase subunit 1
MGMPRRLQHIADPTWQPLLLVAELGAVLIACGILCQLAQLYVSIRDREALRDRTGDPWGARTLEWATASPPPAYNFAVMPRVGSIDAFWEMKRAGTAAAPAPFEPIEMPRNSATGVVTAFFAVMMGFAAIWHIWWMAILGLVAAAITAMVFGWRDDREFEISVAELARAERART